MALWDWVAGALIVCEAVGTVSRLDSGVMAAGPTLHDVLRALVTPTAEGGAAPSPPAP
ncbi:hypothetical protein [Streptomyces sp. NPDC004546]|uniref:hypothetical protein n=1 Tax=unclassified Streptomyces TaxID=2593676 RepID=UPI0033B59590